LYKIVVRVHCHTGSGEVQQGFGGETWGKEIMWKT